MKTLMRNGRDRRSENPRCATRAKSACFWLGPISGSHQGPQPQRLHSEAGYMAAPERFAETSDSFPLHRGRRPYMAHSGGKHLSRYVRSRRKLTLLAKNRGPVHYSEPRDQATMPSFGLFVYRSGRSPDWIKSKNPNAPAVKRKAELGR